MSHLRGKDEVKWGTFSSLGVSLRFHGKAFPEGGRKKIPYGKAEV